ncbi:MAG: SLOG family protein [Clostridia bacterium]
MKKDTSLCFTGHRTEKLPKTQGELEILKQRLWDEIDKAVNEGIDTFYMGACYGFDLLCGDMVLVRKKVTKPNDPPKINLIAVVPYENQAVKWSVKDRDLYFDTLSQCDEVITLSTKYHKDCYKDRNQYMVDHSSRMIAYHDGGRVSGSGQTVRMAEKQQLHIINLYE